MAMLACSAIPEPKVTLFQLFMFVDTKMLVKPVSDTRYQKMSFPTESQSYHTETMTKNVQNSSPDSSSTRPGCIIQIRKTHLSSIVTPMDAMMTMTF